MKYEIRNVIVSAVLLAMALCGGCGKHQSTTSGGTQSEGQSEGSLEARVDKHGEEILASSAKAEARQWMKQPKHVFFKADPKQVGQFVEEFYRAGATQVLVADIEEHDGTQYGEALLVVLPKDSGVRAKLFEVGGRADTAFQNDAVSDKGQKYLYYSLD